MSREYREKMQWYAQHGRFLYPFEIKSIWDFVKNTPFDKRIRDKVAKETLEKDLMGKKRSKTYHKTWGAKTALSKFNTQYAYKIISFFSCKNDKILDPFAGRTRQIICQELGRDYQGFEINSSFANEGIIVDDCLNVLSYFSKEHFHLLFTCPPYWNVEKYSKDIEGDLSRYLNYEEFLSEYKNRFEVCLQCIKEDGLVVIVVADFRYKNRFISLHNDTINMMNVFGWDLYDCIILEMNPTARRCFYAQAITKRRMLTTHEYCLVFHKNTSIAQRKFVEDKCKPKRKFSLGLKVRK